MIFSGSYTQRNAGDTALHLATRGILSELRGDLRIVVHTRRPVDDAGAYEGMEVFPCSRGRWRDLWLLGVAGARALLARAGVAVPGRLVPRELAEYDHADLVVDLSGDALCEDWGVVGVVTHLVPLWLARLSGTPVILYGQSFGPFRLTRPLVRRALRLPTLLFPRERVSEEILAGLGVDAARVVPTVDPALSLAPAPPEEARRALAAEGLAGSGATLAVAVSPLFRDHYDRRPAHRRARRRFVDVLASALDRFVAATGARVLFLPFATAPARAAPAVRDDREVARQVAARARAGSTFVLAGRQHPPPVLRGMLAECELVLAARMHASVLAAAAGVPSVGLAYSHKSPGLFERLGLGEYALAADAVDEASLLAALLGAWHDRGRIRGVLEAQGASARRRHREDARLILACRRQGVRGPRAAPAA